MLIPLLELELQQAGPGPPSQALVVSAVPEFKGVLGGEIKFNFMAYNTLYVNNDNLVILNNLFDEINSVFVDNATVSLSLVDSTNTSIAGPINMPYVTGSDGTYYGVLPAATPLTAMTGYRAVISVTTTNGQIAQFREPVMAIFRENNN